ncbi:MAG TPA: hypothetical protein VGH81_14060 [Rudaea sp.]
MVTGEGELCHDCGLPAIPGDSSTEGAAAFAIGFASPNQSLQSRYVTVLAADVDGNTSVFSYRASCLGDVIFRNQIEGDVSEGCPAP